MKQDVDIVIKCQEMINNKFMDAALKEAEKAFGKNEVPVGCVIVKDNKIIARAHNQRHSKNSVLGHAELIAIEKANKKLKTWILEGCTIYVTLEPCPMCAGAILQSRMDKVIFGAYEPKFGACGSIVNILAEEKFNHKVEIEGGVMEDKCKTLLKNFFQILRQNR